MATDTQPVVEATKDQAKPGTEGTDARKADDLETLLAEYEATTKKPETAATKPETTAETPKGEDAVAKRLETLEKREADRQFRTDIKPAIDRVRGKIDPAVYDDDDIRDWMDREAQKDPRLAQAWLERHQNPDKFARVLDGLSRKLGDRFSKAPDAAATADREAVTAAVRGASTKAPEGKAPDYSRMSPKDYGDAVEKQYGYRPQGT